MSCHAVRLPVQYSRYSRRGWPTHRDIVARLPNPERSLTGDVEPREDRTELRYGLNWSSSGGDWARIPRLLFEQFQPRSSAIS